MSKKSNTKTPTVFKVLIVLAPILLIGGIFLIVYATQNGNRALEPEMMIPGVFLTFFGVSALFFCLVIKLGSSASNTLKDMQNEVAESFNEFEDLSKNFIKKARQFQSDLADDSIECEYCGSKNDGDAHECKNCGSGLK